MKIPELSLWATRLEVRTSDLPSGVVGRVRGVAVVYGVVDTWGTLFKRGSLDKTRAKANAGKVKLFDNHGVADWYGTRTHIGVVRSLMPDGDREVMEADLFDTEDGRRAKEYLTAVMASGADTGLSIGFYERSGGWVKRDGASIYEFDEVELDEISLAPRQAVPGAEVMGVRRTPQGLTNATARALFRHIRSSLSAEEMAVLLADPVSSDEETPPEPPTVPAADEAPVSLASRLATVRSMLTPEPQRPTHARTAEEPRRH
jgi:HK97 family phage prohead protease